MQVFSKERANPPTRRLKGHADADASGWPPLATVADLAHILTTIAWTTSAHHAAVNFGQVRLCASPAMFPPC